MQFHHLFLSVVISPVPENYQTQDKLLTALAYLIIVTWKGWVIQKIIDVCVSISIPNLTYLEAVVHCLYFIIDINVCTFYGRVRRWWYVQKLHFLRCYLEFQNPVQSGYKITSTLDVNMAAVIGVNEKYIHWHMIVLVSYFCDVGCMIHTRRPGQ